MSRKLLLPFLFLVLLLLVSCRRNFFLPETLEAHYVQYHISYLESMAGDIPTRILPARMDSWYTDYFVLTKIEGFFRQFSLIQIADLKNKRVSTLLNLFGNKIYHKGKKGELPVGIIAPSELHVQSTGEHSVIGGLNSEQVSIDTGSETFNMYYTRDFSVRRPNLSTPYTSIDHPLSDFRIQLSYLKMHMSCTKYESRIIESEIFMIPEDYKLVTRPVMEEIINSLFTKE
ncbi:MAG: hypothetical protein U9R49_13740 [Bacteroidota bacterium]|nr:hypothetical protein [Bacteroidota bacterium]